MFASSLRRFAAACAGAILAVAAAGLAQAQDRFAFIVGNDNYKDLARLEKARGDAQAVAGRLAQLGFKVDLHFDTDRRGFNAALAAFKAKLTAGSVAYLHYSGHGVQMDGDSFLLPVDVPAPTSFNKDFIKTEAIRLNEVIAGLAETGARTRVLVIDACRDNPFAVKFGRSAGPAAQTRGLAALAGAPAGTFVMFSASTDQAALDKLGPDDREPTSVYTRVLLKHLGQAKPIDQVARDVRGEVMELARQIGHDQRPSYYDELTDRLYLASLGTGPQPQAPVIAPPVISLPQAPPANVAQRPTLTPIPANPGSRIALPALPAGGPAMVFADSNARFLNAAEVAALAQRSPQLLNIAKNEIFARHGRKFVRADLDRHFRQYPWYRPLTDDDFSITSRFNLFEKANVELLSRYERR